MAVADGLARALLTALATLADLVQLMPESTMAISTLEGIAFELGEMGPEERAEFLEALDRIAREDPDRADWIRSLPGSLGLVDPGQ
jgi:hypothetical protein